MSADDKAANNNYYKRLAEEMVEADQPHNRQQALLDHWWQTRRDEAVEHQRLMRELNPTGLKIW